MHSSQVRQQGGLKLFDEAPVDVDLTRKGFDKGKGKGSKGHSNRPLSELEARIAAEAAAAIEKPALDIYLGAAPVHPPMPRFQQPDDAMVDAIAAAQAKAANRRGGFDIADAQSHAASLRYPDGDAGYAPKKHQRRPPGRFSAKNEIDFMIRGAQYAAARSTSSHSYSDSYVWTGTEIDLQPKDFLGNWVDSTGNPVQVYSTDAWEVQLTAAITRPGRRDTILTVRQLEDMSWSCGNSWLDTTQSSAERICWVAGDGRISIWTRGRK